MKLSEKVQFFLFRGKGTPEQQKDTAMRLAKLAPVEYTNAVITGEKGVTIGAKLLTADDLIEAFEAEIQLSKAVLFELKQGQYFNKLLAEEFIKDQKHVYRDCIKRLKEHTAN